MLLLSNYIIEVPDYDWSSILESWSWLLPEEFNLWFINKFGDLFLEFEDGSINILSLDSGTLNRVALNKDDFSLKVDNSDNFNDWFLQTLVDKLIEANIILKKNQCYGFKIVPILGGSYGNDNIMQISIPEYLKYLGDHYEQLSELPDGAKVKLVIKKKI